MLDVQNIWKRLGGTIALDGVSFVAKPGNCISFQGGNGAGKSTLLSIVAGVMKPGRGEVLWNGQPAYSRGGSLQSGCGFVPEAANPPMHLTVADLLHLLAAVKQCPAISSELRERLNLDLLMGARLDELSLGQRRRACLGAALVGSPELLVLDEPTNGLDPQGIETLISILQEQGQRGAIIVLATHDLEFSAALHAEPIRMQEGRFLID